MVGLNSYFAYGNRKNSYLLELSQIHYYKNIANNLALVTLVIDRVQVISNQPEKLSNIVPRLIFYDLNTH